MKSSKSQIGAKCKAAINRKCDEDCAAGEVFHTSTADLERGANVANQLMPGISLCPARHLSSLTSTHNDSTTIALINKAIKDLKIYKEGE
jgi:hypothetical protein